MKLYTRSGDEGKTSVIGGRVSKDDAQVEAYGTLDELNAFVGQAMSMLDRERFADLWSELLEIQHELFDCGSDLAYADPEGKAMKVTAEMVRKLEDRIDAYHAEAPELARFILPGGGAASSALHVCRTVCRRAERRIATLAAEQPIHAEVAKYVNRLSDYFFAAARAANVREGVSDVEYERSAIVFRTKR